MLTWLLAREGRPLAACWATMTPQPGTCHCLPLAVAERRAHDLLPAWRIQLLVNHSVAVSIQTCKTCPVPDWGSTSGHGTAWRIGLSEHPTRVYLGIATLPIIATFHLWQTMD